MTLRLPDLPLRRATQSRIGALTTLAALALAGCAGTGPGTAGARPCADTVRVAETRIVAAQDANKLTLASAVDRMSAALLRAPEGSAWTPEAARAMEIRDHRTDLSILVEDAEWVLALSTALNGPLPSEDKSRLRRLHERYAARAPHAEVAAQVAALLETVRDETLRRDLKKLANRSWERERRQAAKPAIDAPAPSPSATPPTTPSLPAEVAPVAKLPGPAASDSAPADASIPPERFCADKRADAARAFADARNASDAAARERLLRQSLESLDACIARYPDAAEAAKARQNRARVAGELNR